MNPKLRHEFQKIILAIRYKYHFFMYKGIIQKMFIKHNNPVDYSFIISDTEIPLNGLIGEKIQLNWGGVVQCMCGKQFSKMSKLTQHMKIHSNPEDHYKYPCDICGKKVKIIHFNSFFV